MAFSGYISSPSSTPCFPFMAQGGGGGRERGGGIFLIKMQFYKYLFYLMLQELNIIFLLLDLGGLPTDWLAEAKAGTGKEMFSSSD